MDILHNGLMLTSLQIYRDNNPTVGLTTSNVHHQTSLQCQGYAAVAMPDYWQSTARSRTLQQPTFCLQWTTALVSQLQQSEPWFVHMYMCLIWCSFEEKKKKGNKFTCNINVIFLYSMSEEVKTPATIVVLEKSGKWGAREMRRTARRITQGLIWPWWPTWKAFVSTSVSHSYNFWPHQTNSLLRAKNPYCDSALGVTRAKSTAVCVVITPCRHNLYWHGY